MKPLKEILIEFMSLNGLTPYQLADKSNVSQSTLSRILNKESKPSQKTIANLSKYMGVSESYLRTGNESNMQESILNEPEPFYSNSNGNTFTRIDDQNYIMKMPLIEIPAQAGFCDGYGQVDYITGIDNFHSIIVSEPHKGKYLAFRVKGDSMDSGNSDAIMSNSIVTVRELKREHWSSKLKINDFPFWIVCHKENGYPLLKKIINHNTTKGVITCHSTNQSPEFTDFDLNLNEVTALFYVVDISRPINKFNQNYDY